MNLVFEVAVSDKAKLVALLEADPYAGKSFSRNGYKLRDGATLSQDPQKAYLYMKATEEFAKFAREKLSGVAAECKAEAAGAVAKKIEDEESSAEQGFGSIFGAD